jgi:hypothetical protein
LQGEDPVARLGTEGNEKFEEIKED